MGENTPLSFEVGVLIKLPSILLSRSSVMDLVYVWATYGGYHYCSGPMKDNHNGVVPV